MIPKVQMLHLRNYICDWTYRDGKNIDFGLIGVNNDKVVPYSQC